MQHSSVRAALVFGLACMCPAISHAQDTTPAEQAEALRVFLDCQTFCDSDHFRREIAFVNYVRDRRVADVHVLLTSQRTGGGGREYTFHFIGLQAFAGREDTLRYVSSSTDTDAETRDGQTHTLTLGLVRYAAHTRLAPQIAVSYREHEQGEQRITPEDDPWNLWTFRLSVGGSIRSESRTRDYSANGSFFASRVTDEWKIELVSRGSYDESRFELEEDSVLVSTRSNYRIEAFAVRSIGSEHWAAGAEVSAARSTRFNQDFALRAGAAVEYSIFPYSESTRRAFTLVYSLSVARFNYEEITLFDRTEETRVEQDLEASIAAVQPWGSVRASLEGSTFLHDLNLHRLEFSGFAELRIFRGLELRMGGSIARVKDQIYLPREDISEADILLRRRQLGTDFELRTNVSLSFRFGSIFNNVVNPRLDF